MASKIRYSKQYHNVDIAHDHPRWEEYKFDRLNPSYRVKKKYHPRRSLMRKEGQMNIAYRGLSQKGKRFLKDVYSNLIETPWRYALVVFFGGYFACYFVFAVLYWILGYIHGDFHNLKNPDWIPCLVHVTSFLDCFLLSMETQSTIGYGTLYPHPDCGGSVPLVYLQMTIGWLLETVLLGFIFVRLAKPKDRRQTLMFSKSAVVCKEDDEICLEIRVGDYRRTHLIDASLYGMLVEKHVASDKYVYPLYQKKLEFVAHEMDQVFLIWPLVFRHKINKQSPMWSVRPDDLILDKFEIIIFLEATIETTGELVQAKTSYTAKELIWGHRFARIEEYDERNGIWCIDFVRFNNIVPSVTPKCSAEEWETSKSEEITSKASTSADDKNEKAMQPLSEVDGVDNTSTISLTSDASGLSTASDSSDIIASDR